jgi:hypothetical protein
LKDKESDNQKDHVTEIKTHRQEEELDKEHDFATEQGGIMPTSQPGEAPPILPKRALLYSSRWGSYSVSADLTLKVCFFYFIFILFLFCFFFWFFSGSQQPVRNRK